MPNRRFASFPSKGGPPAKKGTKDFKQPERTAAWPSPGKGQPRARNAGTSKCKCHAKAEGI